MNANPCARECATDQLLYAFCYTHASPSQLSPFAAWPVIQCAPIRAQPDVFWDLAAAERFMADHYDTFEKKIAPGERSLCGHVDLSPRGMGDWQPPFGIAGTVQNKATDATLAQRMSLVVAAGHSCGIGFKAAEHLTAHPEFAWQKPYLKDMPSRPWTVFEAAR